jgi:hypothetical protein
MANKTKVVDVQDVLEFHVGDGKLLRFIALALAGPLLAGCAGANYVVQEYGLSAVHTPHENADDRWRIFDKPEANKLMISPGLGTAAAIGTGRGLTFGAARGDVPKPLFERAVLGYLGSTGRRCRIVDGYMVLDPQWEFKYDCSTSIAPQPAGSAPARRG